MPLLLAFAFVRWEQRVAWGRYAREAVAEHYSVAKMQDAVLVVYGELL